MRFIAVSTIAIASYAALWVFTFGHATNNPNCYYERQWGIGRDGSAIIGRYVSFYCITGYLPLAPFYWSVEWQRR